MEIKTLCKTISIVILMIVAVLLIVSIAVALVDYNDRINSELLQHPGIVISGASFKVDDPYILIKIEDERITSVIVKEGIHQKIFKSFTDKQLLICFDKVPSSVTVVGLDKSNKVLYEQTIYKFVVL